MINYNIEGGDLPVLICYPEEGQTLCSESGAMSWMTPNMQMETKAGGFGKAMGRVFSGESLFLNEYTATGGTGMIAFASSFPGNIIPYKISRDNELIVQKSGLLAMEKGVELSVFFQRKLGSGFFGGEGFIMQRLSGEGMAFIEIDGFCKEYTLTENQTMIVDTGYLAAMSATCKMDIVRVKGVKNVLFGGEGLFNTKIQGPGKIYLQSMPISHLAGTIAPKMGKS